MINRLEAKLTQFTTGLGIDFPHEHRLSMTIHFYMRHETRNRLVLQISFHAFENLKKWSLEKSIKTISWLLMAFCWLSKSSVSKPELLTSHHTVLMKSDGFYLVFH